MSRLVIEGPEIDDTVDLDPLPFHIGRSKKNDLQLKDRKLSRQHCVIKKESGSFLIEDLDSKNGCYINGEKKDRHKLNFGDKIQIGRCTMELHGATAEYEIDEETAERLLEGEQKQEDAATESQAVDVEDQRLLEWVEPFQQVQKTPPKLKKYVIGAGVVLAVAGLLYLGFQTLMKPVEKTNGSNNLLVKKGSPLKQPNLWTHKNNASIETIEGNRTVLRLGLSPDRTWATSIFTRDIPVQSDNKYVLETQIFAKELTGLAGVLVKWTNHRQPGYLYRDFLIPMQSGNKQWEPRPSRVVTPPAGATHMSLSFVALGTQGTIFIDQPKLQKQSGQHAPRSDVLSLEGLPLSVDRYGQFVSQNVTSSLQLLQGGLRYIERKEGENVYSKPWTNTFTRKAGDESTSNWFGTMFTPLSHKPVSYKLNVRNKTGARFRFSFSKTVLLQTDGLGFQFPLNGQQLPNQLQASVNQGTSTLRPGQTTKNVQWIEIPFPEQPIRLAFSRPLSVSITLEKDRTRLVVNAFLRSEKLGKTEESETAKEKDNRISLGLSIYRPGQVKLTSSSEKEFNISRQAFRRRLREGREGEAFQILEQVQQKELSPRNRRKYDEIKQMLLTHMKRQIGRIKAGFQFAETFGDLQIAQAYTEKARAVQQILDDQSLFDLPSFEKKFKKIIYNIRQREQKNQATALYERFRLFDSTGRDELARSVGRHLLSEYSDSPFADTVRSRMQEKSNEPNSGNGN